MWLDLHKLMQAKDTDRTAVLQFLKKPMQHFFSSVGYLKKPLMECYSQSSEIDLVLNVHGQCIINV